MSEIGVVLNSKSFHFISSHPPLLSFRTKKKKTKKKNQNSLVTNFSAWTLWCDHNDSEVITNLHTLLNNVEAVAVRQRRTLLHQWHDVCDHCRVLLVWCQIENEISFRYKLVVRSNMEAVGGCINEGRAFTFNGLLAQSVADVAPGVTHVETLVQTLRSTSDDDNLQSLERFHTVVELVTLHEAALRKLLEF